MPTPTKPDDQPLRPLSAEAFIKALKGETVVDENGEEVKFLQKNDFGRDIVLIEGVVISENIFIEEGEIFQYYINLSST